jgi:hypothetical protein
VWGEVRAEISVNFVDFVVEQRGDYKLDYVPFIEQDVGSSCTDAVAQPRSKR